jgi:hypothetical protein
LIDAFNDFFITLPQFAQLFLHHKIARKNRYEQFEDDSDTIPNIMNEQELKVFAVIAIKEDMKLMKVDLPNTNAAVNELQRSLDHSNTLKKELESVTTQQKQLAVREEDLRSKINLLGKYTEAISNLKIQQFGIIDDITQQEKEQHEEIAKLHMEMLSKGIRAREKLQQQEENQSADQT